MNLYKFITHQEIEFIAKAIKNKKDFEIERKYKKHEFRMHSSRAKVDFKDGTKKDDYFVGMDFSTDTRGWGIPISGKHLEELEDASKLKGYIDEQLGKSRITGYETIREGQVSLFEMML